MAGVLPERLLEILQRLFAGGQTLFVRLHEEQNARLGGSGDLLPAFFREGRFLPHAAAIQPAGYSGKRGA